MLFGHGNSRTIFGTMPAMMSCAAPPGFSLTAM
jgi:hypothetical protein